MNTDDRTGAAIALYNALVLEYARRGVMPTYDIMPQWKKSLLFLLYKWEWIALTKAGIELNRPTERGLSADRLAALLYRYQVR